jgi:hypothetical protein
MISRPRTPSVLVFVVVSLAAFAVVAHAAPVLEGQLPRRLHRTLRSEPVPVPYQPGQPIYFPRELLPLLMGEMDADIQEPGDDVSGPLPTHNRARPRVEPLDVGPNHLINQPSGDPAGATQSENSIAADGRYVVAGWNDSFDPRTPGGFSGYGYSTDGGRTWVDGGTLPAAGTIDALFGDPNLAADGDGNFYYASLYAPDANQFRRTFRGLGVTVSRGRFKDGVLKFGPPVLAGAHDAGSDLDKEWIAVDRKDETLYVTYTRFFEEGGQQIELVRSRDHGKTWSAPTVVSNRAMEACQGSRPIVGDDHDVFVVYAAVDLDDFQAHMRIRRSTNDGKKFGPGMDVGEAPGDPGIFPNTVSGPPGFNRPNGVEFPSIAYGRGHGHHHGTLYVTWPEAVDFFDDPLGTGTVFAESEANNSPATATAFTPGDVITGSLSSTNDQDWFQFTGQAGQTVIFFLTPPLSGGADGFLRLFCRGGGVADRLAVSYLGGGQGIICFTLPSTGTYFVRALALNSGSKTGPYFIFTGLHAPSSRDVARDSRDVMISRSRDGVHWSRRTRVNDDQPRYDNAFPEVAVDDEGDVHVVWYDHREDADFGIGTDLYHARSRDGGKHFDANHRVNDGPAVNWNLVTSQLAPNMGDYISLGADHDVVYANWGDGRLGSPDSWLAAVSGEKEDDDDLQAPQDRAIAMRPEGGPAATALRLRVPNPVRTGQPIALGVALPEAGEAVLELYAVTGQRVSTLFQGPMAAGVRDLTWDLHGGEGEALPPGLYFLRLRQGRHEVDQRIVLLP